MKSVGERDWIGLGDTELHPEIIDEKLKTGTSEKRNAAEMTVTMRLKMSLLPPEISVSIRGKRRCRVCLYAPLIRNEATTK